ncbi:MAG: hypothetical protein IJ193_09195 [Bacilli bacterium]|nr:hypothetical protein [Bacilli bacterium]
MKKNKMVENDSWLYTLLLSTLVILTESLKTYTFHINGVDLTYSLFLLPLIYLLTNYITKKYNYAKSVSAICLSGVAMATFVMVMSIGLGITIRFPSLVAELGAYIASQIVNLFIYYFLLQNTNQPVILTIMNYLFALVVYYMLYTLFDMDYVITDTYWIGYFTTLVIQLAECIILGIIDKNIKRGLEE